MGRINIEKHFGDTVRGLRKKLGITQEELFKRAGLHRSYISDLERGARNISLKSVERLADALGTSVSGLFFGFHDHPQVHIRLEHSMKERLRL